MHGDVAVHSRVFRCQARWLNRHERRFQSASGYCLGRSRRDTRGESRQPLDDRGIPGYVVA